MKFKLIKSINHKGETIVEVLVALVVIGSALAGAFAISNRASKSTQANYERYQAQVIASSQVEMLDKNLRDGKVIRSVFGSGVNLSSSGITTNLNCFSDEGAKVSGEACKKRGFGNLYTINIQCLTGEADCTINDGYRNYRVFVEWISLKGGKDKLELFYGY